MLFTVYDSRGEPFAVRPHIAKSLVIQEGWSMEAPKPVKPVVAPADPKPVEGATAPST